MGSLRRIPGVVLAPLVLAGLAFVISFRSLTRSSLNGDAVCSRTEMGAYFFGALAVVVGAAALWRVVSDYRGARLEAPLNAATWTLNPVALSLSIAVSVLGIALGGYRILWALSVANDCLN